LDVCLVSVVCCQLEVSATSWSLVQRSPTECGVSKKCDREASKNKWGGLGPQEAVEPLKKSEFTDIIKFWTRICYHSHMHIALQPWRPICLGAVGQQTHDSRVTMYNTRSVIQTMFNEADHCKCLLWRPEVSFNEAVYCRDYTASVVEELNVRMAIDGMMLTGENRVSRENLSQRHSVHHKPHTDWYGTEPN
jgi:hypothetical protein